MKDLLEQFDEIAEKIEAEIERRKREIERKRASLEESEMFSHYSSDHVDAFFKRPYVILPRKKEEWYLIVPKLFDLNVGYLTKSTDSYNVFIVNKYADYLGAVPAEFKSVFKFKPRIPLKIFDGVLLTGEEHQDTAWDRYRKFLTARKGNDRITVKRGQQFDLIAKLIEDGILPFIPQPVDSDYLVESKWYLDKIEDPDDRENVARRLSMEFFQEAVDRFMETGAVGIYWAMGVGKTLFGLELLSRIRVDDRPNLVISGTSAALRLQWTQNLELIEPAAPVVVETYQSLHKVKDKKWGLEIIDECHHLPSNFFSRAATIDTLYRAGLSATPYREDGRTDYIIALTGWPVGLDWRVLIELGLIGEPEITLFLCESYRQKRDKIAELLQDPQKTLIYSFGLDLGKSLSKEFDIPFVHGSTPVKDRLEIIRNSQTTIISSAGREGLSIRDLERTITYNFLFGSRQEETQFFGRLLHGEDEGHHILMMTDEEYEKYGKRIYGIQEKGFKIQIVRSGHARTVRSRDVPKRSTTKRRAEPRQARLAPSKKVVAEDTSQFPPLDERRKLDKELILEILGSDYVTSRNGVEIKTIKAILDHSHIKYKAWYTVRNLVRQLYKDFDIAGRTIGRSRIYFLPPSKTQEG